MALPKFDENGWLPKGVHPCTWAEFTHRFAINPRRTYLAQGLFELISIMAKYGNPLIFVGGSFVTVKEIPGDYDICWSYESLTDELLSNLLNDHPVFEDLMPPRNLQKALFRGEFLPAFFIESSSGLLFLDFFQLDKDSNQPKGIVQLIL